MRHNVAWLGLLVALTVSQSAEGIINSTAVVTTPSGISVYPCHQINYRLPELEPSLTGQWYVIEIIKHKEERSRGNHFNEVCPKLNLYKLSDKDLKLTWHEKAGDLNYSFQMVDEENRGYWLVWDKQTGSMLTQSYQQFVGSVQVLEADPSKMVLMFCTNNNYMTHYSVIMVRNITVPHDTVPVRNMLKKFGLPELSVHTMCKDDPNSSTSLTPSVKTTVLSSAIILAFFAWKTELA